MDDILLSDACTALHNEHLVVYPTETIYALGADIFQDKAVKNVFTIKQRPFSFPLSIGVSSLKQVENIAKINMVAEQLIHVFLPGPLTIILEKKPDISSVLSAGKNTIGIRIPNDPVALKLLSKYGPLTCTSANIHGKQTPESVIEIRDMFKSDEITVFLDDGNRKGLPSTIVDVSTGQLKICREGSISIEELQTVVSKL